MPVFSRRLRREDHELQGQVELHREVLPIKEKREIDSIYIHMYICIWDRQASRQADRQTD